MTWSPTRRSVLALGVLGGGGVVVASGRAHRSAASPWAPQWTEHFGHDVPQGQFRADSDGRLTTKATAPYAQRLIAYPDGWRGTNGVGIYQPSRAVHIARRTLTIRCFTDPRTREPISAAVGVLGARTYGRWAWRMRCTTTAPGWGCVCLLWPKDDRSWPRSGELDWPEGDLSAPVGGFFHPAGVDTPTQQAVSGLGRRWSQWNDYAIDWTPTTVTYWINGRVAFRTHTGVPNTPMRWVVQGGRPAYEPAPLPPTATAAIQLTSLAVWAYNG